METWQDHARSVALSIGVHLICFGLIAMGLWWQKQSRPLSVAGAPIEAVLWTGPVPSAAPAETPPPAPQPRATPPPAKAEPAQPLQRPDTVDRERAAALTQQQSRERAQREEQERQRQRQIELSEQERQRQARSEAARRALEEDRRRQAELAQARSERERAERQARLQQERLAQLADLERPAPVEGPRTEPRADEPVGNFGTDTGLAARYMLAVQQTVTQNWLRPDTTRPGLQCRLRIIQIPGGDVISVQVLSPCNGDELTRRSIEAAVLRAQPLPYTGYESVFQRDITFNFRYDG
ncbi:MAG TPA: cell envelope integrity protein TolA [Xanthomonadaceae bacterium]|nr:cell envelope integrity protein TolA [Xanthomonadaceae bacterium]